MEEYVANRSGILTSPGVEYIGWEKLPARYRTNFTASTIADLARFPPDWPEVEYEISQLASGVGKDPSGIYGTILAVPVSPLSRGTVSIMSNDTSDLPIINPNWLTHPTDQQVAIEGFLRAREMFNTKAIQPIIIGEEVSPGSSVQTMNRSWNGSRIMHIKTGTLVAHVRPLSLKSFDRHTDAIRQNGKLVRSDGCSGLEGKSHWCERLAGRGCVELRAPASRASSEHCV